jgi:hypothetical protein
VNLTNDFLRIFLGDIPHILRKNHPKLPHLGTPFKEIASSKQDFKKNYESSFNAGNHSQGNYLKNLGKKPWFRWNPGLGS